MKIDPTYNNPIDPETGHEYDPITEEFGDEHHYAEEPEDAWLDAAYEDRWDIGYEPEYEY